ncbi:MAG: hypothetical protein P6D49_07550 [Acidimicrobiales bacterium]|nr:hypothetical protein [Acidimicrobiales bacterium]
MGVGHGFGLRVLNPHLAGDERLGRRIEETVELIHRDGAPPSATPGYGMSDLDHYLETLLSVHEGGDVPFRQYPIPAIGRYRLEDGPDFAPLLPALLLALLQVLRSCRPSLCVPEPAGQPVGV